MRSRIAVGVAVLAAIVAVIVTSGPSSSSAQSVTVASPSVFRVGEKLSYNISFGKIPNAGYAETYVASRGKLSGKDSVEIRAKVKTFDLVSAVFFLFDESRTTFAAPDTGLPHYIVSNSLDAVTPKETVRNYLTQPSSNFDLLTLMYKARESGGIGSFPVFEGDQMHTVSFQTTVAEKVKTDAGEFDTTVSNVQSDFLAAAGLKDVRINFANDEFHIPVLLRFKTLKGEFRISLAAVVIPEPEAPAPSPSPTPTGSPRPTVPAKATPTPSQYVDDQPLIPDLGFQIGEILNYRIGAGGKPIGILTLSARERRLVEKVDSLLVTATITGTEQGTDLLLLGDEARVRVDPETLTPIKLESKFASKFAGLNQTVVFDRKTGVISFGGKLGVEAPIGTHSFLSLIYAMRSFNLKPSKDPSNPVNDTRVSVFWENKSYVFTLRPAKPDEITLNGEKVSAQLIIINTGNKDLDALNLKVWLRTDDRVPLRFTAGTYQADLITPQRNLF